MSHVLVQCSFIGCRVMEAYVTLAPTDHYGYGALVLAHSLKMTGTSKQLAVLVSSSVSSGMRYTIDQHMQFLLDCKFLVLRTYVIPYRLSCLFVCIYCNMHIQAIAWVHYLVLWTVMNRGCGPAKL